MSLIVGLLLVAGVQAQTPSPAGQVAMTLQEALQRASMHNLSVQMAEADHEAAQGARRQTLAAFLPRLTASEEAVSTNDPLSAFGFKLKQERVTAADFAPPALNDPDRVDHFSSTLELQQPILNVDGIYQRRAATRQARAAEMMRERTEAVVAFHVKQGYYGLVLAGRRVAVLDSALAVARRNQERAQRFFEQDLLNRADLLAAQVRVLELESQQTEAASQRQHAAEQLRYLLGIDEAVDVVATEPLPHLRVALDTVEVARVNRQRSDMQALRYRADAASEAFNARRAAFLPKLNAFGGYEWNDDVPFGTRGESWMAGASLTWNIFSGFENAGAAQRARAEQRKAELAVLDQARQNEVEIDAALRDLRASRQQLRHAEAAVDQAREALRIRTDRYEQGLEQTTDVLNAEVTLANKRLGYLHTLYQHDVNVFRLELLTERPLAQM